MRQSFWNKKIPTLLGLLIIMVGVGITTYLVQTGVIVVGKASPSYNPEDIRITNVSDTSFTVSYMTKDTVLGSVSYGTEKTLGSVALDDRDQPTGNITPYTIHSITVRNVKPTTKYFFAITSGQTTFLNQSTPFEVTTATAPVRPLSQLPLTGKVVTADGTALPEAIMYIKIPAAQTLSVLVKPDGNYTLPLNAIRYENLDPGFAFSADTLIQILVTSVSQQSQIKVLAKQTNPVPLITLSQNYDFTVSNTIPVASTSAESFGFPSFSAKSVNTNAAKIITPKEAEGFTDERPLFKGTAIPNETVTIEIHSTEVIQEKVTADASGNWNYRPKTKLSPGEHTITIVTKDATGILKKITQSFTVYASGTQVNQSATPSATPTIKLTVTPTAKPTLSPTVIPTILPTNTPIPTPTLLPTSTVVTPTVTPITTKVPTPTLLPISQPGELPATGSFSLLQTSLTAITSIVAGLVFMLF